MKLNEVWQAAQIRVLADEAAVIKKLHQNCSGAMKRFAENGCHIFRGVKGDNSDFFIGSSNEGDERTSANTNNLYTAFLSKTPTWNDVAKRDRSFICTNSYTYALDYGESYAVFPYDTAKISIAREHDFWFSFSNGFSKIDVQTNSLLCIATTVEMIFEYKKRKMLPISKSTINSILADVDQIISSMTDEQTEEFLKGTSRRTLDMFNAFKKLGAAKTLETLFDPELNKIETYSGKTFPNIEAGESTTQSREIWIEGDAIFIKYPDVVDKFLHSEYTKFLTNPA